MSIPVGNDVISLAVRAVQYAVKPKLDGSAVYGGKPGYAGGSHISSSSLQAGGAVSSVTIPIGNKP